MHLATIRDQDRLQFETRIRKQLEKKHKAESDRLENRRKLLRAQDGDFYQEWWDTLPHEELLKLVQDRHKNKFTTLVWQVFRNASRECLLSWVPKLMATEPMQFLLRDHLSFNRELKTLYERHLVLMHGKEALRPAKKWWKRDKVATEQFWCDDLGTIEAVPSPRDFFNNVWLDAFSLESGMAKQNHISLLRNGLGKHGFSGIIGEIRRLMYGTNPAPTVKDAILREDRVDDILGRQKKRRLAAVVDDSEGEVAV